MTVAELVNYFDLLQDKYGSPYFTTSEKETFLTQAQLDLISKYLPQDGGPENAERNANNSMVLSPISFSVSTSMDTSGVITKASVESSLSTALGFTATIIRPSSITWSDSDGMRPVMGPTRQNNWAKYQDNAFKDPVVSEPRYYETAVSYIIDPVNVNATIVINGLRYPKAINVAGNQTSELASIYHTEVVARALEIAGVGSRDQMLSELKKLNGV
ncbi:MAG TPA: hypothetical protein VGD26_10790 [Chitinophagaceae bacterium]